MMPDIAIQADVRALFAGLSVFALLADRPPGGWPSAELCPPQMEVSEGVDLATHPRIAPWRGAVKAMGLKAAEQRSSVEQLVRRWRQDRFPETGLPLVDAYNRLSLRWLVPMGAYDVERLPDSLIQVRLAQPETDRFIPLGGGSADFPLRPGVVVYAVGDQVICWALNVRDSATTCALADSRRILLVSESLDPEGARASEIALRNFRDLVRDAGGAVADVTVDLR